MSDEDAFNDDEREPIVLEEDNYPSVEDEPLSLYELEAAKYWEEFLPQTVAMLKAQGPLAFPTMIRKLAHQTMFAEELELLHNPQLSRQQARSIFEREWLFPPPEPRPRPKEDEDEREA